MIRKQNKTGGTSKIKPEIRSVFPAFLWTITLLLFDKPYGWLITLREIIDTLRQMSNGNRMIAGLQAGYYLSHTIADEEDMATTV